MTDLYEEEARAKTNSTLFRDMLSEKIDDIGDIDGDGVISKNERKLWQALDADGDGSQTCSVLADWQGSDCVVLCSTITPEEMMKHAQGMPMTEWTPFHVRAKHAMLHTRWLPSATLCSLYCIIM